MSTKGAGHRDHPEVTAALGGLSARLRSGDARGVAVDSVKLARAHDDDARIHDIASTALAMIASRDRAHEHALRAIELLPTDPGLVARCVSVLQRAGDPGTALSAVERAMYAHKNDPRLHKLKVALLTDLGRGRDAARAIKAMTKSIGEPKDPGDIAALTLMRARLAPEHSDARESIEALRGLIGSETIQPGFRRAGAFQLGRLLESVEDYEGAWSAYTTGNELLGASWDPDAHSARIDALIQAWPSLDVVPESTVRPGPDDARPVFVLGMMRSGSSLLEQMLAQLDGLVGGDEQSVILEQIARLEHHTDLDTRPLPISIDRYTQDEIDAITRAGLAKYTEIMHAAGASGSLVSDKQTEHFLCAGLLARLFPDSLIIHTTRNPIDTCVSNYVQSFAQGHPHTTKLDWIGRYHTDSERLMAHWRSIGVEMIEVNYAQLVSDPESVTRNIAQALGLEWSGSVLDFHKSKRTVSTASRDQVRQPIHTRSVGRAERFSAHLDELRAALTQT